MFVQDTHGVTSIVDRLLLPTDDELLSTYSPDIKSDGRPIEFRLGASLLRGSHMVWLFVLLAGIPLVAVLAVALMVAEKHGDPTDIDGLLTALRHSANKNPSLEWQLLLLAVLAPIAVIYLWAQRLAYIRLSSYGIEGYVPKWTGLGITGLSTGHWKVYWESVRSVRLSPGKKTGKPALDLKGYRLSVETDQGQIRLSPFSWVLRGGPDHRLTFRQALPSKGFDAEKLVESAPLTQALRARGLHFLPADAATAVQQAPAGYDLAKHSGLVVQLVLFFVVGLYALVDAVFIGSFKALAPLPLVPFMIAALVGTVLVWALGKGAPPVERAVVGILVVAVLAAAVYPGLLRFNAMTAQPQEIHYRSVGSGRFESPTPDLPAIDLRSLNVDKYWARYPSGTDYAFVLLRGAGGFYELDLRPLYERTRAFYSRR